MAPFVNLSHNGSGEFPRRVPESWLAIMARSPARYARRQVISLSVKIRFPCLLPRVTRNTRHAKPTTPTCAAAAVSRICFRSEEEEERREGNGRNEEEEGEKMGYKSGGSANETVRRLNRV